MVIYDPSFCAQPLASGDWRCFPCFCRKDRKEEWTHERERERERGRERERERERGEGQLIVVDRKETKTGRRARRDVLSMAQVMW